MSSTTSRRSIQGVGQGNRLFRRIDLSNLTLSGQISVGVLLVITILAALGPVLLPLDSDTVRLGEAYAGPSAVHLLGTDGSGRDLLSRLIDGARTALIGPFLVIAVATVLGTLLGLTAAWFSGWFDTIVVRVIDAIFAFPGLLLAILATALFGAGLTAAVAALSIAYIPYIARVVRGAALRERSLPYVAALQVQGIRGLAINTRHILPNIAGLIVANSTVSFGWALIDLAALSFIGLGVQAPTADWGAIVGGGMAGVILNKPAEALWGSVLIVLTVAAVNTLGDRLIERSEKTV